MINGKNEVEGKNKIKKKTSNILYLPELTTDFDENRKKIFFAKNDKINEIHVRENTKTFNVLRKSKRNVKMKRSNSLPLFFCNVRNVSYSI